jgi:hypothetical protein
MWRRSGRQPESSGPAPSSHVMILLQGVIGLAA